MSLLLDQHLVGEVAEYCPTQFLQYYNCLGNGDAMACIAEQKQLANCAKTTAPSFKKIVSKCTAQMNAYEQCIKKHPDFRTRCFDELTAVRECTAAAVGGDVSKSSA